jgi:soluble lytic murein transglycosylase
MSTRPFGQIFLLLAVISTSILPTTAFSNTSPSETDLLQQQRKQYQQTLLTIKRGLNKKAEPMIDNLESYPLHPYLLKADLQRRLRQLPYQEIDQFFADYGSSTAGKQLRKKWLKTLAKKRQWPQYLSYYQEDIANKTKQCWRLEALHQTGNTAIALDKTSRLWLNAESLPSACDNVFKRWQQAGRKTDAIIWQRLLLALDKNNYRLARYITAKAPKTVKVQAKRLLWVHRKPEYLQKQENYANTDSYTVDIVYHGLKRLAAKDNELATQLWVDYRGQLPFSNQQHDSLRDQIARQVIASGSDKALGWLITHDPNADDSYLMGWRIRLAIKQQQWRNVERWINLLPNDVSEEPRWQYWMARAIEDVPAKQDKAQALYQSLASQRHYYGFLAADRLGNNYGFNHSPLQQAEVEQQVADSAAIQRAKEFFKLGELTNARREWNSATQSFDQQQLIAATSLANQWQWHQQAIHTTIKADQWNDLSIRFPLAYQNNMIDSAKDASINPEWLYAIARQESAFASDAFSSAGARGLLQLRPSTAKQVARSIGMSFRSSDLYKPEKNITLGSQYLKQLLEQFEGNRILATAAYNAGPHRVNRWLKNQNQELDYDIWIETLPFHETRNYVQNVLAFSVIYGYRLGNNAPLIAENESRIR